MNKETKKLELQNKRDLQARQEAALEDQNTRKTDYIIIQSLQISELSAKIKEAERREAQVLNEISRLLASRSKIWGAERGKGQRVNAGDLWNNGYRLFHWCSFFILKFAILAVD